MEGSSTLPDVQLTAARPAGECYVTVLDQDPVGLGGDESDKPELDQDIFVCSYPHCVRSWAYLKSRRDPSFKIPDALEMTKGYATDYPVWSKNHKLHQTFDAIGNFLTSEEGVFLLAGANFLVSLQLAPRVLSFLQGLRAGTTATTASIAAGGTAAWLQANQPMIQQFCRLFEKMMAYLRANPQASQRLAEGIGRLGDVRTANTMSAMVGPNGAMSQGSPALNLIYAQICQFVSHPQLAAQCGLTVVESQQLVVFASQIHAGIGFHSSTTLGVIMFNCPSYVRFLQAVLPSVVF